MSSGVRVVCVPRFCSAGTGYCVSVLCDRLQLGLPACLLPARPCMAVVGGVASVLALHVPSLLPPLLLSPLLSWCGVRALLLLQSLLCLLARLLRLGCCRVVWLCGACSWSLWVGARPPSSGRCCCVAVVCFALGLGGWAGPIPPLCRAAPSRHFSEDGLGYTSAVSCCCCLSLSLSRSLFLSPLKARQEMTEMHGCKTWKGCLKRFGGERKLRSLSGSRPRGNAECKGFAPGNPH